MLIIFNFHRLLKKKLRKISPIYSSNLDTWNDCPHDLEILNPPPTDGLVWPLHWFIRVKKVDAKVQDITENLEKMSMLTKK